MAFYFARFFFYCCFVFLKPFCLVEPYCRPVFCVLCFNSYAEVLLNIRLQRHLLANGHPCMRMEGF